MNGYAIYLKGKSGEPIRLPTNPEKINYEESQDSQEYDIVKLGKIVVPGTLGLITYSFTAEFPHAEAYYIVNSEGFRSSKACIEQFREWRKNLEIIELTISSGEMDIVESVIIESLSIEEKAGEEGDYYIGFKLKQYKPFGLKEGKIDTANNAVKVTTNTRPSNPPKPANNTYVVRSGDTLWALAKRYLGDGSKYPQLFAANKPPLGNNPNLIQVGQKLTIPSKKEGSP